MIERDITAHLDLVTALLALLDDADGDPDLEPDIANGYLVPDDLEGGDVLDQGEPSLGWTEMEARFGCSPEPSYECEIDDADDEPSLGAPEPRLASTGYWGGTLPTALPFNPAMPMDSQVHWARGRGDDDEQVNEDGGDVLDEPHDANPHEDLEYSVGVDCPDRATSTWTPERPEEGYQV